MNPGRALVSVGHLAVIYPSQSQTGPEVVRFCTDHRWASRPVPDYPGSAPEECPWCRLEVEETSGRERYDALSRRLLEQQLANS